MKTLFFIFSFILLSSFLNSTIINIPADQTTIQAGITASVNTDTVLVQPGTYVENINFNGKLITVGSLFLTTRDTSYISSTIIDGNNIGRVVTFENGEDGNAILIGFIITEGNEGEGGGIYCYNSSPGLQNLIITGNIAGNGGGIYCYNSSLGLENVTLSSNTAVMGGGIFCSNSFPSLQNITMSGNIATTSAGGIFCGFSSILILNSILWGDSPQEIIIGSGSVTVTYSDIQGGWTGTGNIDSDPLFVDPGNGNFHLQSTSPCIDTGDPASPLDPDGTFVEMGAYYFPQPVADFISDITNGEVPLTVNFTDLSTPGTGVIDEWSWDFGDGNDSSLQNPANEYLLPGSYTVSLTVTDVDDLIDTETKMDYIAVNPPAYSGPVWHISTTGSDVWGNGSTQYPLATIQYGINASSSSDTVLVQPGTYLENINFNGKLITVGSLFLTTTDTTYISSTIIDGNSSGIVVTFENGEDSTAVLVGFKITNGSAYDGGGVYCASSSPSLEDLTILSNSATNYGGGIYCSNSSSSLNNVTISGNSTVYNGGGICCFTSSLSLQNVTISGNTANYDGGGIWFYNSCPSFVNVTISGNSAANYGGGICCRSNSNPILQNVTITGNSAYDAGGVYCYNSYPILINSILWNNSPNEIYLDYSSVTATYSDIQGGWAGTGNIDIDPLFADPGNGDYHLSWTNFPVPDATMSPCIDAGDPSSSLDPDATIADMGVYFFDRSPGAPVITAVTDVPDDQGRYVQLIWNRTPYDAPNSPVPIESYSVWRYDDVFDRGQVEIFDDPQEIFEEAAKNNDENYYWQRDDEILTFITQLQAMGFAQYSIVSPTLKDSSVVSINYSAFKVFAYTDVTLIYFPSLPDSGYSVDNIAPDVTEVLITKNGSNMNLNWDEVEYGTFEGNSYPEVNGVWYKIYASDTPDFICDELHLIDTVTSLNYDYQIESEDKKFFKIVVSDQP